MKAIRVHRTGGAEQLAPETVPRPQPGWGEVLVRIAAAGVNFIDVYHRTGLYSMPLPFTPGLEAAGVVEACGEGVTGCGVGDRVAWAGAPGAYAHYAVVPHDRLVSVPDGVSLETAAAVMLQGMTAHYLIRSTYPLAAGEILLLHAAAGGVGLLVTQMAARLGATVIGTVSTGAKAELARGAGAAHVIRYTEQDFAEAVSEITGGAGVPVVYDSVGRATFDASLSCLRPRGTLVLFGQSSGPVPPVDPARLSAGSLYLTRPSLLHYTADPDELAWRAREVLDAVAAGELDVRIDHMLPLDQAARAHRMLEGRETTGKVLLVP